MTKPTNNEWQHYHLSEDGSWLTLKGGERKTWRSKAAALSALKSGKAQRKLARLEPSVFGLHVCHCQTRIASGI
jgi:hypothetical protein